MTTQQDTVRTSRPARILHLDNLRVFLTLLVVVHHSAIPYSTIDAWPRWQQYDPSPTAELLDLLALVNQTFFMGFFFLLSGYFATGAAGRRGPGKFAVERLKRLGIPFIGFMVLLRPFFIMPDYFTMPAATRPSFLVHYFTTWQVGPAWFLELLLIFSLAYALVRHLRPTAEPARSRPLRRRELLAFMLVLSVLTYAWRIFVPHGTDDPVLGIPSLGYMPQYVLLFAVGVVAYRRHWFTTLPRGSGRFGVLLVVASSVPLALGGYQVFGTPGALANHDLPHLAVALAESLFTVGVILFLLRGFERFASGTSPFGRYLADNAFPVYLVHAPVIVGTEALLLRLDAGPLTKFVLTLVLAATGSWAISGALRRVPAVRAVV